MGLRDLERRIERGVDGVLGRVFRAGVTRIEIDKRVERELEAGTRPGDHGARVMPNDIEVRLHPLDAGQLDPGTAELQRELVHVARNHARDLECTFEGPLIVRVVETDQVRKGAVEVLASTEHAIDGVPPGTLVYPNGYRFDLAGTAPIGVTIGRDAGADIIVDDDRASRRHARLRPSDRGWVLDDLDSTNGTRVNGFRTAAQLMRDGDLITIGATTFLFDAS